MQQIFSNNFNWKPFQAVMATLCFKEEWGLNITNYCSLKTNFNSSTGRQNHLMYIQQMFIHMDLKREHWYTVHWRAVLGSGSPYHRPFRYHGNWWCINSNSRVLKPKSEDPRGRNQSTKSKLVCPVYEVDVCSLHDQFIGRTSYTISFGSRAPLWKIW
jgi:hypothetical protein